MKRKDFLKISASAAIFLGISPKAMANPDNNLDYLNNDYKNDGSCFGLKHESISKVKVGIIGLGNRGSVLIQMFDYLIKHNLSEIVALCDLNDDSINKNLKYLKTIQEHTPEVYRGSVDSWKELVKRDDIDLIIVATP